MIASYQNNQSIVNLGNNVTGYFYTQLPTGESSNSNRLYLFVQIFDNSGGISAFYIASYLVVQLNSATLVASQSDILSMSSSSPIVQSLSSSDISVASSAIIAFSSSFNAASNSSNASSSQLSQAQQVSQLFVSAISNYDLTSMSSMKAAASALSVVSANPEYVSSDTAVLTFININWIIEF